MDQPKNFTKTHELKPGLYFVESEMYFPLRGNGLYSQPMIEFCLSEVYITKEQITYSIEASLIIPSNYFNDFVEYCFTELGECRTFYKFYDWMFQAKRTRELEINAYF
jgi:hypothetical protein